MKYRIQYSKETTPIHLHLHSAGPRQKQLKSEKVDKMLKVNFTEPVTAEWALLIVIAPRKDGRLRFFRQ